MSRAFQSNVQSMSIENRVSPVLHLPWQVSSLSQFMYNVEPSLTPRDFGHARHHNGGFRVEGQKKKTGTELLPFRKERLDTLLMFVFHMPIHVIAHRGEQERAPAQTSPHPKEVRSCQARVMSQQGQMWGKQTSCPNGITKTRPL